jgi:aminobenzoyl-glutamate utilization protein B
MNMMVNMMREHVPQETRIHYVITAGGNAPNVVPDYAEVFYYLRHPEAKTVKSLWERLEAAARGAAEGTGTRVEWEIIHGNHPILVNETLHKMMDEEMRKLDPIHYDESDERFAKALYASFDQPAMSLGSYKEVEPYSLSLGYGSTDVGDVSMAVPTVGANIATFVPGTAGHSWQAVAAGGTPIGFRGADFAARALSSAAVRLYTDPALREAAIAEFKERRGDNFKYEALLGDRKPPLDYRE